MWELRNSPCSRPDSENFKQCHNKLEIQTLNSHIMPEFITTAGILKIFYYQISILIENI
jgi:hypothetical protein